MKGFNCWKRQKIKKCVSVEKNFHGIIYKGNTIIRNIATTLAGKNTIEKEIRNAGIPS